jgi:hypothetical protein
VTDTARETRLETPFETPFETHLIRGPLNAGFFWAAGRLLD